APLVCRGAHRTHQHDAAGARRDTAALQRERADAWLPPDTRDHGSCKPPAGRAVWDHGIRPHGCDLDCVVPPLDVTSSTRPGEARIDPQAREVMEYLAGLGLPPIDKISPMEARRQYREVRATLRPPAPHLAEIRDLKADGKGGPIPLR